jgi:hypothetical protein
MFKAAFNRECFKFLDRKYLIGVKTRALRSGAWFKVLQRIDRVLFELTIRVVDNIHSPKLAKSILALAKKMENTMRSSFSRHVREIGLPIAQKIVLVAQKLGNTSAINWETDSSFTVFLAIIHINQGIIFRH